MWEGPGGERAPYSLIISWSFLGLSDWIVYLTDAYWTYTLLCTPRTERIKTQQCTIQWRSQTHKLNCKTKRYAQGSWGCRLERQIMPKDLERTVQKPGCQSRGLRHWVESTSRQWGHGSPQPPVTAKPVKPTTELCRPGSLGEMICNSSSTPTIIFMHQGHNPHSSSSYKDPSCQTRVMVVFPLNESIQNIFHVNTWKAVL